MGIQSVVTAVNRTTKATSRCYPETPLNLLISVQSNTMSLILSAPASSTPRHVLVSSGGRAVTCQLFCCRQRQPPEGLGQSLVLFVHELRDQAYRFHELQAWTCRWNRMLCFAMKIMFGRIREVSNIQIEIQCRQCGGRMPIGSLHPLQYNRVFGV